MTQQTLNRQNGAFMKIVLIGANGKIGELVPNGHGRRRP